jgi:hypothetical protein
MRPWAGAEGGPAFWHVRAPQRGLAHAHGRGKGFEWRSTAAAKGLRRSAATRAARPVGHEGSRTRAKPNHEAGRPTDRLSSFCRAGPAAGPEACAPVKAMKFGCGPRALGWPMEAAPGGGCGKRPLAPGACLGATAGPARTDAPPPTSQEAAAVRGRAAPAAGLARSHRLPGSQERAEGGHCEQRWARGRELRFKRHAHLQRAYGHVVGPATHWPPPRLCRGLCRCHRLPLPGHPGRGAAPRLALLHAAHG